MTPFVLVCLHRAKRLPVETERGNKYAGVPVASVGRKLKLKSKKVVSNMVGCVITGDFDRETVTRSGHISPYSLSNSNVHTRLHWKYADERNSSL